MVNGNGPTAPAPASPNVTFSTSAPSSGGGFTDIRGATGIAQAPTPRRGGGSQGGGSVTPSQAEINAQASLVNRGSPEPTPAEIQAQASLIQRTPTPPRRVEIQRPESLVGTRAGSIPLSTIQATGPPATTRDVLEFGLPFLFPVGGIAARGVGLATRAPAIARAANVISRIPGASNAARIISRPGVRGAGVIGAGGTLEVGGALSSQVGTERGARQAEGITELRTQREREDFVRSSTSRNIQIGLTGRVRQEINEQGEVVASSIEAPAIGDEGLLGSAQRFALSGVPGFAATVSPDVARQAVREELRARNIPVTEANVKAGVRAIQEQGLFSTGGILASEIGSELIGSQLIRGGSPAIRAARTPGRQALALGTFTVPRIAAVGAIEGASQTFNTETLTSERADPGRVLLGAGFGAASAGAFTALQSVAIPFGAGRAVQVAGFGFDFPGEPIGDLGERAISRAFGRGPGLRVPVLTGGTGSTPSAPSPRRGGRSLTRTTRGGIEILTSTERPSSSRTSRPSQRTPTIGSSGVLSPTRTVNLGGRRTPVDEFGLPVPPDSTTPSETQEETPSETESPALTDPITGFFTETQGQSDVGIQVNVGTPSLAAASVAVPAIVPDRFPFLPPGRLGGGGGRAGRGGRLGFFDEFAAAFSGLNPRTGRPINTTNSRNQRRPRGRPPRRQVARRGSRNSSSNPSARILRPLGIFGR